MYKEFRSIAPQTVIDYFDKNWNSIKDEWVYYALNCMNLLNDSNNRLESLNAKIKDKVGTDKYFLEFVNLFFLFMELHQVERDGVSSDCIMRKSALRLNYDDLDEYKSKHQIYFVSLKMSMTKCVTMRTQKSLKLITKILRFILQILLERYLFLNVIVKNLLQCSCHVGTFL